jgi:acetyl esterase/lipase
VNRHLLKALFVAALTTPAAGVSAQTSPSDVHAASVSPPTTIGRYGPAPEQFGELRMPPGRGPFPVAVIIHGGCWTRSFETLRGTSGIATALQARGIATWNIEYRALGDPGAGWPGTFLDWGAATDHLRVLARRHRLDLRRTIVVGHSAGAHAAAFVATRRRLPAGSEIRGGNPLRVRGAVLIDGPPDIAPFAGVDEQICGAPVISQLMGGTPAAQPARYRGSSPLTYLPLGIPLYLVAASPVLPREAAEAYRAAAEARGDRVEILAPAGGDHFNIIFPGRPQWSEVENFIVSRAVGTLRR